MATVHLVHGFNVTNGGATTTDLLAPYFERVGCRVAEQDYGFVLLTMWFTNKIVAKRIAGAVEPGDIGVGHSNGCAILTRAADAGAPFDGLVLINPALDADIEFAPQLKWVHVYYNQDDGAVAFAEVIPQFLNWRWGDMGARGYIGFDSRIENVNCQHDQGVGLPRVEGHSDIFRHLPTWGAFIAAKALAANRGILRKAG